MIKKTYDLTEFAERERISNEIYDNSYCVNDNEKYMVGMVRLDVNRCDMEDDSTRIVVEVYKLPDGCHDLDVVARDADPFMGFVLDDVSTARALVDFTLSHFRAESPFDEAWDHVCDFWEQMGA